jgi:hypothetical protein
MLHRVRNKGGEMRRNLESRLHGCAKMQTVLRSETEGVEENANGAIKVRLEFFG